MTPCEICGGACCKYAIKPETWTREGKIWWNTRGAEENEPCQHLKDGKCNIYNKRPTNCMRFKVGSKYCIDAIKKICPEKLDKILEAIE